MSGRMFRHDIRPLLLALTAIAGELNAAGNVVVIANANLTRLDAQTVEQVYTGRIIQVEGIPVTAVNAASGSAVRSRFLQTYLKQDEDRYTGYWLVRRYSGLGASPRELASSAEIINYVKSTPGAIGYIDEADVQPGLNVLLK